MKNIIQLLAKLTANLRAQIQARVGGDITLTEREKIGLVVGTTVVLLAAWLGLSTWAGGIQRRYDETRVNLARLKSQVESGAWSERKRQSHVLRTVLESRFWMADTPGLAEAGFERWIRDRLNQSHIDAQQIQVRRVPIVQNTERKDETSPLSGLQRMTAKVYMPFDEQALIDLLTAIADNEKAMVVDRLTVRAGRNARAEIDVSTFFRYHQQAR